MSTHRGTFGNATFAQHGLKQLPLPMPEIELSLARLSLIAKLMDSAVRIPGTTLSMGFDALLGLVPIIGDAISGMISSYVVWEAKRLGAPKLLLVRMAGNVAIDTIVGSIPFAGDLFDVSYKSNVKNVALLIRHLEKQGYAGRGGKTIDGAYPPA